MPGTRVWLVDENWPEIQAYVQQSHGSDDVLGIPLDGRRFRAKRYAWRLDGFRTVGSAPVSALQRGLDLRSAPAQGAARRTREIHSAKRIATSLSRLLTADVTAVTVAQSYLPFLWRDGHLGGRDFSVLMTNLPIGVLEARLNAVASKHPERANLTEFRAPEWLKIAETEALSATTQIISPHAEIAAMFGDRAIRLPWQAPKMPSGPNLPGRRIAFPGATIARKGAYEVRQAASILDLEVVPLGAELEGDEFWSKVQTSKPAGLHGISAVVQPAIVETQPRKLIAALAAGIPVIATPACGLDPQPGLVLVPWDDPDALIDALKRAIPNLGSETK